MNNETHELIGWFFLTRNLDNSIQYQGQITKQVDHMGYFMVDFFSWMSGGKTYSRIVTIDEIHNNFYFTGKTSEEHEHTLDCLDKLYPIVWRGNGVE